MKNGQVKLKTPIPSRLNTKYQPGLNMQTTQALLPFYLLLVICNSYCKVSMHFSSPSPSKATSLD